MKIALVTDAWQPQVNGVVTTLVELVRELRGFGHEVEVIEPNRFKTRPCPGYAGIDLAVRPKKRVFEILDAFHPDAIHIATEGPLGWAARRYCLDRGLAFTTAFHTKFPEIVNAATKVVPVWLGYIVMRLFHGPSSGIMVPTLSVLQMLEARGLKNLRAWTHGVDTTLFQYRDQPVDWPQLGALPRPLSMFVGRVSYEKNIEAFLKMDFPGTKIVCGVGPVEAQLKQRYPEVKWVGLLPRDRLAELYGAADVFVFPSHADTFGLVMVEAMACGTPVAAYPVDGPLEVLGRRDDNGRTLGGAMDDDLRCACEVALTVPRAEARARALDFSWSHASKVFENHLVPARNEDRRGYSQAHQGVTKLSSDSSTLT